MASWTSQVPEAEFPLNLGAVRNLRQAVDLLDLDHGGYLRASDYGFVSPQAAETRGNFGRSPLMGRLRVGQPTAMVNFPLLMFALRDRQDMDVSLEREDAHVSRSLGVALRRKSVLHCLLGEKLFLLGGEGESLNPVEYLLLSLTDLTLCHFPGRWVGREELIKRSSEFNEPAFRNVGIPDIKGFITKFVDGLFSEALRVEDTMDDEKEYHLKVSGERKPRISLPPAVPALLRHLVNPGAA